MAGYNWKEGMSNNAVQAYEDGQMPISKWTKKLILENIRMFYPEWYDILSKYTKDDLCRIFLRYEGYHHTSKFFNSTNFYSFVCESDDEIIKAIIHKLDKLIEMRKLTRKYRKLASDFHNRADIQLEDGTVIQNCYLVISSKAYGEPILAAYEAEKTFEEYNRATEGYRTVNSKDPELLDFFLNTKFTHAGPYWIPRKYSIKDQNMERIMFRIRHGLPKGQKIIYEPRDEQPCFMIWNGSELCKGKPIEPDMLKTLRNLERTRPSAYLEDYLLSRYAHHQFTVIRTYRAETEIPFSDKSD